MCVCVCVCIENEHGPTSSVNMIEPEVGERNRKDGETEEVFKG